MKGPIRLAMRPVLVAGLLLALACPALAARVASVSGSVEAGRGEPPVWKPLEVGDTLAAGERVRTGDDGRAEIVIARATIRLYPNSLLRLPESAVEAKEGASAVELSEGISLFDVIRGEAPFEVHTPDVVVSVKGTRFSVGLDGEAASVGVFRGTVGVRNVAIDFVHEVLVHEGFVASGHERFDLHVLDLPDPWDGFGNDVLPLTPGTADPPAGRRAGIDEARVAALAAARPEVVTRAAERHPEVRERVDQLKEDALENANDEANARDPVVDAPEGVSHKLEERYIETWLNGGDPAAAAQGGDAFTVSFIDGSGMSGGDRVIVQALSNQTWMLEEDLIEDVLDGEDSLPANLEVLLGQEGIAVEDFAEQLLALFD